jgi:hypothetical protein
MFVSMLSGVLISPFTYQHTDMFFKKKKLSVTPEDKAWIEEAFCWFEAQYSREYLKEVPILAPIKRLFPVNYTGTLENAHELVAQVAHYMYIDDADIKVSFFNSQGVDLGSGLTTTSTLAIEKFVQGAAGYFQHIGHREFEISLDTALLGNSTNLIAVIAHELSHLVLLGDGRLEENDEFLTDLNCIAMGFGVFTCNSIFTFERISNQQWEGWRAQRSGYIPEEVATYALALMAHYQGKEDISWSQYLKPSPLKMFERNMEYLQTTQDEIAFR